MKVEDLRIGCKVRDKVTGWEFDIVGIFKDGTVYCDFEENEGDIWEYNIDEIELCTK